MHAVAALALLLSALQVPLVSPEVHADHTVTFRFKDATAKTVMLSLEGSNAFPMTRGSDGVWTITTLPLVPDYYGYTFVSDGNTRLDPSNWLAKPNLIWQSSAVLVPGNELWEVRNVPHGTLSRHYYHSNLIGDDRDMLIYTPPGYESGKGKYPVLYLLHGYSDTAVGWSEVGKANHILDNLIAEGRAKSMIVVMPLGYGIPNFASPNRGSLGNMPFGKNTVEFAKGLLGEVIPMVEKSYRVSKIQSDRAIAGLSMGGAETLSIGLNNLEKFAYVGAFSSGGLGNNLETEFPNLSGEKVNKSLKSLYISCGTEDGLLNPNRNIVTWLKGKGVNVEMKEKPGRHAWMVWRRNLAEFAQVLFR